MTYISAILSKDRKKVKVWERASAERRVLKEYDAPYYFYIEHEDGEHVDIYGNAVKRIDFPNFFEWNDGKKSLQEARYNILESDIRPEYKVLASEYYDCPIEKLNITFFDIEVDYDKKIGFSSPTNPYAPISSVAIYHVHSDRTVVLAVPPPNRSDVTESDLPSDITEAGELTICKSEKELLELFFKEIENSDIISGWNSEKYDIPYVYERANKVIYNKAGDKLSFDGAARPFYKEVKGPYNNDMEKLLVLSGRVSLDYLAVYKKFEVSEKPSYKLESVAEEELPHLPKISYDGSLYDLYRNDFEKFLRYNIRDTIILKGLEEKKKYIQLAIQMSHMATAFIPDILGTIKVAEMSIINYCHRILDVIVPDCKEVASTSNKQYEGATVLDTNRGMHENVASTDIQSLYPSAIRSLNISPEKIHGQFEETTHAYTHIRDKTDQNLYLIEESSRNTIKKTAYEWNEYLTDNNLSISAAGTVFDQSEDGVIPSVLTNWFGERKNYKKLMGEAREGGDEEKREYYDRLQYVKKIQLNSMYGAMGNPYFRFYDIRLAESTTLSGREILLHMAKKIAEKLDGEYTWPSKSIIYGDTDSVYFKTKAKNIDDALKIATVLNKIINKSYPKFMREAFHCNNEHDSLIISEQEVVASKGIFISKKYYILYVVYDDGKLANKLKAMGVPIKKTTLPKHVKENLTKFITDLMTDAKEWKTIGRDVIAYKDELKQSENILDLGIPKGIKGIESYTERFNAKEEGLRLPGHHSASILWNKCLQSYDDKETPEIMSGSKILVFYLKSPIGKFKSIAVPKDLDKAPSWFIENFEDKIDRDAQLLRLVDKPMQIMISAAGLKVPSKKSIIAEEGLFG